MSAPDTDIEVQKIRHRPALTGIWLAVGFGFAMLLGVAIYVIGNGDAPSADAVTTAPQMPLAD